MGPPALAGVGTRFRSASENCCQCGITTAFSQTGHSRMTDLLKIARALTPDQQWQAYEKARATPGSEQMASALELANPRLKLRHMTEHPQRGQLVAHRTQDASGRIITTYHGDPRAWMDQFSAPPIGCSIERPR